MLEFVNRPPQAPQDVKLSEGGSFLLVDAWKMCGDGTATHILGKAACVELLEEIKPDKAEFGIYSNRIRDEVTKLLRIGGPGPNADKPSPGAIAFMAGMNEVEDCFQEDFEDFRRTVAETNGVPA